MNVLRTPDERFDGLPGWDFEPRYVEIARPDGAPIRVHYVDEGPAEGEPVVLLHGEPSWSYLYRKMIPVIAAAGIRAVGIDFVGFGRSDKPVERADYTYQRHVDWTRAALDAIGVGDITLFCQDWGGLIGLRLVGEEPDRFARVVAANTFLVTGDQPVSDAWHRFRQASQEIEVFDVGRAVQAGCATTLTAEVLEAYAAPFPDESYKAGVRQFPMLVPTTPDDPATIPNRAAWEVLSRFEKPFLTIFGAKDPISRGAERFLQALIPGASGQDHVVLEDAG
ncbi:MAG TPA: haloalkane dehalogenase, partial [Actinomycetota bacterium]